MFALAAGQARAAAPLSPAVQDYGAQMFQSVTQQIAADAARNQGLIRRYFGAKGATAEVEFVVLRSGQVAYDRIMRSSGNRAFDADVLSWTGTMILPPFPPSIPDKHLAFVVPYFFRGS